MPARQVRCEKEAAQRDHAQHRGAKPPDRLPRRPRQHQQQRGRQRESPEAGGDGSDMRAGVGQPHEQRPERQRDIAADQGQHGNAASPVGRFSWTIGPVHAAP